MVDSVQPRGWRIWRRIHRISSGAVTAIACVHTVLTPVLYDGWPPDAVWFLGTGLGLVLLGVLNLAHIGIEPCRQPSAAFVRWGNWVFVVFGLSAVVAVPEPQAFLVALGLVGQAIAATWTLRGPGQDHGDGAVEHGE